ncbi:MAG: hypothetical protein QMC78_05535 [Methanocellales archaeon]|nr:hypothetical protein [Methanocellales archaeon]
MTEERLVDADKWKSEELCPNCGAKLRVDTKKVDPDTGNPCRYCPKCEYEEYKHH